MACSTAERNDDGNLASYGNVDPLISKNGKFAVVRNLPPFWPIWQDRGDERGSMLFCTALLELLNFKHGLG